MEIGRETVAGAGAQLLFVDYENVTRVDLGALPSDVIVPFFFRASQKSVATDFLKAALKLSDRFLPIDIEGQGKNALDSHCVLSGRASDEESSHQRDRPVERQGV